MSDYERCPNCKEWGWVGSHKCAPIWELVLIDEDEFEKEIPTDEELESVYGIELTHATDATEAAEKYCAENYGNWDYPESMYLLVRDAATGWQKISVEVEAVPQFTATVID